MTYSEMV